MSQKWSKAQHVKYRATLQRKKAEGSANQTSPLVPIEQSKLEQTSIDTQRFGEFQYRRGLVTAMECILRELR